MTETATTSLWRNGDQSSLLLLDVAAGRPLPSERALTNSELGMAARHGLLGLLALGSNHQMRTAAAPSFARLEARQSIMSTHLRRVLIRLSQAGVRAAVVKGPHLAHWAYPDPRARTFTDVDILVPEGDLDATLNVLSTDEAVSTIPRQTPAADKRHIPFSDPSGVRFTLDLHWNLFSYHQLRGRADGASSEMWQRAELDRDHPLGPLWELPADAILAFLSTHALLDHRFRLILFRDLVEAARRGVEWEALEAFAAQWHLRSPVYLAARIAADGLGAPIPETVLATIRPRYALLGTVERALARTDLVRFDGHRPHPINLQLVLLHDQPAIRLRLAAAAPLAYPRWRRVVSTGTEPGRKRTRLMLLVATDRRRGAEVNGARLTEGMRERGWDVDFVALFSAGDNRSLPVETLTHGEPPGRLDLRTVRRLRARIKATQPRVVFANGGSTLRYLMAATTLMRRRPSIVYGSIGQPSYWLRNPRHARLQRMLVRRADLILAVSHLTRSELVEVLHCDPHRIQVVPVGVPDSFVANHPRRSEDGIHLLFLGAMSPEKNPLGALEVAARLPKARLRYVGSGQELPRVGDAVRGRGLESRVEVIGEVADVVPHLLWADVLVLTSLTEGFPGVVLEAAAAGVPAVAFDVGGVSEAIIDGETGILASAGELDEMAEVLQRLERDPSELSALADNARARVEREFLIDRVVATHDQLFRKVLAGDRL